MSTQLTKSAPLAWGALILIVLLIVLTFSMRTYWWSFIDIFFGFMMVFIHLMAIYLGRKLPAVGRQLDTAAAVMGIMMVLAFIGEFIAFQCIM